MQWWIWVLIVIFLIIIFIIWRSKKNNENTDRDSFFGGIKNKIDNCCGGIKDGVKGFMRR